MRNPKRYQGSQDFTLRRLKLVFFLVMTFVRTLVLCLRRSLGTVSTQQWEGGPTGKEWMLRSSSRPVTTQGPRAGHTKVPVGRARRPRFQEGWSPGIPQEGPTTFRDQGRGEGNLDLKDLKKFKVNLFNNI